MIGDDVEPTSRNENESVTDTGRHRAVAFRARRTGAAPPPVRVLTWKQVGVLLGLLSTIWGAGGKWVVDQYIAQQLAAHNSDSRAHVEKFQVYAQLSEARADRSEINARLDAFMKELQDTNQRLARIEGALGVARPK